MRGGDVRAVGWGMEETGPSSGEDSLAEGVTFVGWGEGVTFALPLKSLEPRLERERERRLGGLAESSGSEGVAEGEMMGSSSIFGPSTLASLRSVSTSGSAS